MPSWKHQSKRKFSFMLATNGKPIKNRVVMVIIVIYGLKYIAMQFRNHLPENLTNKLRFNYSLTNIDLCYKASTSTDDFE